MRFDAEAYHTRAKSKKRYRLGNGTGYWRVYHINPYCPKGKDIPERHRRNGRGTGRHLCYECERWMARSDERRGLL